MGYPMLIILYIIQMNTNKKQENKKLKFFLMSVMSIKKIRFTNPPFSFHFHSIELNVNRKPITYIQLAIDLLNTFIIQLIVEQRTSREQFIMSSFTGETKTASYSTSPSTLIFLQPELISDEYKKIHGITKREFTGGTKNLWLQIYSYLQPSYCTRIELKCLCRLFNSVEKMITFNPNCSPLKPIPRGSYTSFPHPKYATLRELTNRLNGSDTRWIIIPSMLLIANGVYDEGGNYVTINSPISIVGESREHCIVIGGLQMYGKEEDDVNVSNLTLRESKGHGVETNNGASIHLDNVSVENSENCGVLVYGTKRSTMKNCNVSHSKFSGLVVSLGGLVTIDGSGTNIHHNCTDGRSNFYGLHTYDSSSIHLASSVTIETISKNNGGGGNHGGPGTIATVDNEGTIIGYFI